MRMLGEAQHRIADPIDAGDADIVERNFFLEHATRRLNHHADDLVLNQARIDGQSAVQRAVEVLGDDGAGEEVMGAAGAAIANAFFDATGVRLRRYPLTPERVRSALAASRT